MRYRQSSLRESGAVGAVSGAGVVHDDSAGMVRQMDQHEAAHPITSGTQPTEIATHRTTARLEVADLRIAARVTIYSGMR